MTHLTTEYHPFQQESVQKSQAKIKMFQTVKSYYMHQLTCDSFVDLQGTNFKDFHSLPTFLPLSFWLSETERLPLMRL